MEEPLISVIIPAYNERERITDAVRSVKAQGYDRHETIVVANNCSDDTAKIARSVADLVIETPTQGISNAKNLGVTRANGQILSFFDSDSLMFPDLLEKTYEAIQEGYAGGKSKIRPSDDNSFQARWHCWFSEANNIFWLPFPFTDGGSGAYTFMSSPTWNQIVQRHGEGFNTRKKVMEDLDIAVKIKEVGRFKFIRDSGIYTSMRRFQEEGYFRLFLKDTVDVFRATEADRSRWNQ